MKKIVGVTLLACGLLLAGCGNETAKETASKQEPKNETTQKEVKSEDIKITNKEETYYTYDDDYTGEKQASYSATIKNESKENIDVSAINITYLDKKGHVIGSSDDSTAWVSPSVLAPGKIAHIRNQIDLDPEDELGKAEMTISPEVTDVKVVELPVTGEMLDANEDETFLVLRGQVKNNTKEATNDITIGAAVYDKNNKFLTTLYGQIGDTLNPGQKVAFEANSPFLNFNKMTQPNNYEFFAYKYVYPEGTAGEGGDGEVTE
ncbi:hypothetical protein ICR95_20985 [Priestia megaterium]|uniref:FxLYD domain-containing protein n=1 Tax=Priestia megaterium TaxID=1404 RepID=UPI00196ACCCD|nr:FxLYD domain-containing protein [Priestia megaterium]QSF32545.1 hypothetical protein ICR95_20985 [Priestia megaterium]